MEQYLAMLVVVVVAAAFSGVSYLKKKKMYPACDRFAEAYCELTNRLLDDHGTKACLLTEAIDGGLFRVYPIDEQPKTIRAALQKTIDDGMMITLRELFLLRDDIQAQASNGSFAKDKYSAITNQVFESLSAYLVIVQSPSQLISKKNLDQFHYVLQQQSHIRNITLAAIVSRPCAARIALS
jgi:hypothetical protein